MARSDAIHVSIGPAPDDDDLWRAIGQQWSLAPGVTYLNHGSFGAPPRPVLAARGRLLDRLNVDPMHFFFRELQPMLADARARLGQFLNAAGDDLVFVENATVGMNAVARSVRLAPGDEVLTTDHEYGAVMRIWQRACDRAGARLVVAPLACPAQEAEAWGEAIFAAASPRTRLLVVSHVTSPTAVVLPVAAICARAGSRHPGVHRRATRACDCAGRPGGARLRLLHGKLSQVALGPVGAGFLYVHPRAQSTIEPAIESWGRTLGQEPSWRDEFNWSGTRDVTPCLSVPAAIDFIEAVGVEAFRRRTHWLAKRARETISALTGLAPLVPDDPAWYGSMVSLPLPAGEAGPLQDALWERFRIEVPIFDWQGRRLVRVSCQLYTNTADIERLGEALRVLLDLPADATRQ